MGRLISSLGHEFNPIRTHSVGVLDLHRVGDVFGLLGIHGCNESRDGKLEETKRVEVVFPMLKQKGYIPFPMEQKLGCYIDVATSMRLG